MGVISSDRALSWLAQYWQKKTTVSVSLEPNVYLEQFTSAIDYNSLLEQVSIIDLNIELEQLLAYLRKDALVTETSPKYLVIDEKERLLGLLDTQKLLNFLLFNSNEQRLISSPLNSLGQEIINLIECIDLPIMLQSNDGEFWYQNSGWRDLFASTKSQDRAEIFGYLDRSSCHCPHSNFDTLSTIIKSQIFTSCYNSIVSFSQQNYEGERVKEMSLDFPTNGWQYLKLSFNFTDRKLRNDESSKLYWLIVAYQDFESSRLNSSNAELIQLNKLKDRLLADISHELKSPLTGIIGLSSLLKEKKIGKLNQRQTNYIELINKSGYKLINIVNDLLELTNLTTGKFQLNLEPIDIEPLCRQIYKQVINKLDDEYNYSQDCSKKTLANLHFQLQIEPIVNVAIADKRGLSQILSHLLSLAVISAQPQGEVGINVSSWDSWISFTVWDSGQGGSQFTSLWQSEKTLASDRITNIDLGAILVQQLAKAHGGNISVIPRLNKKNEVTLLLPNNLNSFQIASDMTTGSNSDSLVLLVESELSYIEDLTLKIKDLGYHPLVARSGTEALQKTRQFQPSYVLLNPNLPILSGKDVLTLLKADSSTQNIPIFIFNEGQNLNLYSQANGFIEKPIDALNLAQILPNKNSLKIIPTGNVTILCLYPELEAIQQVDDNYLSCLDFHLQDWAEQDWTNKNLNDNLQNNYHYRIIEAEGLEQADMLARIWQLDVVIIDGAQLKKPDQYLRSLQASPYLATLPLITLDAKTTAAANQIEGLNVYPCLVPAECRNMNDLMEVVQIAAGIS
ncbi:MAG: HAMP domain-containing sensor histidine kinase [Pleurocapsa sp.]